MKETEREETEREIVKRLAARGWHITFAESCTGGLCAARLVDVPDASSVFDGSFVTYSNAVKQAFVGVASETLEQFGAVSEQTAGEMAKGAAAALDAEIGVGISGIAGPGGGTSAKPVGTVCFGFWIDGLLETETCHFTEPDRNGVRAAAVDFVCQWLLRRL